MHDELSPIALFFKKQGNSIQRRISGRKTYYDAQRFVATDEVSGKLQADILFQAGLKPESHVLEIGCGCLSAGAFLIRFLEPGHYVGIDPNAWLRETAFALPQNRNLRAEKKPEFLGNMEFDASELGRKFDFMLSHSILSHASASQLPLFLNNTAKVLAPSGRIFASLILAEGNEYGNPGSPDKHDTNDKDWVYPGVSCFTRATVDRLASDAGLKATYRPDLTKMMTAKRKLEVHDWFEFTSSV